MKKIISILIVSSLLAVCIHVVGENTGAIYVNRETNSEIKQEKSVKKIFGFKDVEKANGNDSHFIEGVPYVSQETGFYSAYASPTMIFRYLGVHTSLQDVLFILGVGYSLAYSKHSILPGWQVSRDYSYLSSLYGLSYDKWLPSVPEEDISESEPWGQYWIKVKENITNDIPVLTGTNFLSYHNKLSNLKNPKVLLKPIMRNIHAIVIVGFNESNQTVCYNDPAAVIKCENKNGYNIWRDLTDFKKGFETGRKFYPVPVMTFKKISEPLPKEIIFNMSHERNIERMRGNISVYNADWVYGNISEKYNELVGIKALEKFKNNIRKRLKYRYLIVPNVKFSGFKKGNFENTAILSVTLSPIFFKIFEKISQKPINSLKGKKISKLNMIYTDKNYTLQYLRDNSDLLQNNSSEIKLFEYELENWSKLNERIKKYLNLGLFMKIFYGRRIINGMEKLLENIMEIENEILLNVN